MRIPLSLALALLAGPALSAETVDDYLAARDRDVAAVTALAGSNIDAADRKDRETRKDLEAQLLALLRPARIPGFPSAWEINLETLSKGELGFGRLDGLAASSADGKARLIVTTEDLLGRWLREHRDWWEAPETNVPQDAREALASESFYTQAIQTDAAVSRFVAIPTRPNPGTAFVFAMLAGRSQNAGPWRPDEIMVSAVMAGRVYVVTAPVQMTIGPAPGCKAVRTAAIRKADEASRARPARTRGAEGGPAGAHERAGDVAYRRCFAEWATHQPFFATVAAQAQALVDRLPAP